MTVPIPTPIFRITHVDNLDGNILPRRGIYAANMTPKDGLPFRPIHHQNIQVKRSNTKVPYGPRGTIHDYVPFYFAPRSPMLYAISRGGVELCDEGQKPIIYLVSTAQSVAQAGLGYVFTDGHGIMAPLTSFFTDLGQLDQVDWEIMEAKYWRDEDDDMDRKRRRQAEFLVYKFFPWEFVDYIAVIALDMKERVQDILSGLPSDMNKVVKVNRDWYY